MARDAAQTVEPQLKISAQGFLGAQLLCVGLEKLPHEAAGCLREARAIGREFETLH
jgi:hypothetical protein